MNRVLIAAAVAAAGLFGIATADAANRNKEKSYYPHARTAWSSPVAMRRVGPPWAMPNECYTDEGYGRYLSCDSQRR